ncbi:MAG: general stress protein [Alkalibacterium sp.]|nr:general stress protein [Alkalibacterium sp.]
MMQSRNKTVVGVYGTRDEALEVVGRLKDAGYQKENIILYANEDVTRTQSDYEAVNIEADTTGTPQTRETQDDDNSLWEQIKDAFSSDTYDHEESKKRDTYRGEDDLLYPYRADIKTEKSSSF